MTLFMIAVICSWKLVLGKEELVPAYQYFSPGNTTTLVCNTTSDTIYWNGPAYSDSFDNQYNITNPYGHVLKYKTSPYASNNKTNSKVPHVNRLQLYYNDGTFSLIIRNTTNGDEGLYICDASNDISLSRFILLLKTEQPSGLMLSNTSNGSTVIYTENQPVKISCIEDKGYPPSVLNLLRNGTIIKNGTGQVSFDMTPTETDMNSSIQCVSKNTYWNRTDSTTVIIDVHYKPRVEFHKSSLKVKEGSRVVINCSAVGNPQVKGMEIVQGDKKIHSVTGSQINYLVESINRSDTGNYICMAKNKVGWSNDTMRVVVLYPPDVYVNYSSNASRLRCVPKGNPDNYTFEVWEHQSFFGEHIRFLNPSNRELVFNETTYQDSGLYVCNVTNGIKDQTGKKFQQGYMSFFGPSPPIALPGNSYVQNGTIGKQGQIHFDFVSFFLITCQILTPMNQPLDGILTTHLITNRKSVIKFHNVPVTVNSSRVTFIFQTLQLKHFQRYRVTVCNQYGNLSYEVDFRQVSDKQEVVNLTMVIIIPAVCLLVMVFIILLVLFAVRRRQRRSGSAEVSIEMEGEINPIENRLYDVMQNEQGVNSGGNDGNTSPGSTLLSGETNNGGSEHNTLSYTTGDPDPSMERRLNYADVVFSTGSVHQDRVVGPEDDRTVYADVDPTLVGRLPDPSSSSSSSDDDFMFLHGIENYIERRAGQFL